MTSKYSKIAAAVFALAALAAVSARAQSTDPLAAATQKALNANPEVTARFNAFRAAADAVDAARAGYLPRLDMQGIVGTTNDRIESRLPQTDTLPHSGVSLTVTQMLWDGLLTSSEVGRLGHEKLARYFEFVDVSEQTALAVTAAWYDVLRYRKLVSLAEDNYVQHKYTLNQIQSRVRAGVGRGVDYEQALARMTLAESNLVTEVANLHDVTARYQRLVGEAPPAQMAMPPAMLKAFPANADEATGLSLRRNAAISASVETLRAARETTTGRKSAFQPTLQARLRTGVGHNYDGVLDQKHDTTGELVLNWNLFNGGADQAKVKQQANIINQAADLRDKACRDTRQTVGIAYNDTKKLAQQLIYLDQNTLSIEKARDAYRQQFDIGQRNLLDLLNAENELYTAKRAYANAEYDLGTAQARTQAAVQQLTAQLGISRIDAGNDASEADRAADWASSDDAPMRCPPDPVRLASTTPFSDLDARAQQMTANAPPLPAQRPTPTPPAAPKK